MIKNIFQIKEDTDALESFFECISYCSINSRGIECMMACYSKQLKNRLYAE